MSQDKIEAEKIAKSWLDEIISTVSNKNLDAHLNLISKKVNLTGIPGYDSIGYEGWSNQCQHEFENNIIKKISYSGFILRANTTTHIMFKTFETVEANDGTINAQGIEVTIEKESDGHWRVVHERVLPDDESLHDGLQ